MKHKTIKERKRRGGEGRGGEGRGCSQERMMGKPLLFIVSKKSNGLLSASI